MVCYFVGVGGMADEKGGVVGIVGGYFESESEEGLDYFGWEGGGGKGKGMGEGLGGGEVDHLAGEVLIEEAATCDLFGDLVFGV